MAWEPATLSELVDRIVAVHHGHLRWELPRLATLVERVTEAYGTRHPELGELRAIFKTLKDDVESHMVREEWSVFPTIKRLESSVSAADGQSGLTDSLSALEGEHREGTEGIARIRKLAASAALPDDASGLCGSLLRGLANLEADVNDHIYEEDQLLFPRVREAMASLRGQGSR